MTMMDLAGRTVVVLGAGRSGVAAARLVRARGAAIVVIVDNASAEKLSALATELSGQGIDLRAGFGASGGSGASSSTTSCTREATPWRESISGRCATGTSG